MANHLRPFARLLPALLAASLAIACCAARAFGAEGKAPGEPPPAAAAEPLDALSANLACYVCHTTFVEEELAKTHLKEQIGCIKCHGLSDKHANDENIGATKPDIIFQRRQVNANCAKCHEGHDAPAQAVIARFLDRKLPADRAMICTDCHGMHKIDHSAQPK
jgi:hypothetical protein